MDINTLRTLITAISFIVFIGIVLWAYHSNRKSAFADAAMLPFAGDDDNKTTRGLKGRVNE